ncbi:MAG: hypothetical protein RL385_1089 [Pseudomonadota bacterium]|jgi:site-specific recombinase XerD
MPRKATGTLVWHRSGWHGRYWAVVDGERKRVFVDLETKNTLDAESKLAIFIARGSAQPEPGRRESFEEAATRVVEMRRRTIASARAEASYMRTHVVPAIGRMYADEVGKRDVLRVLDAVRDKGLSPQTIVHVRNAIAAVYRQLRKEGVVSVLPVPDADELPEALPEAVDDRPKAILSDTELLAYLAYTDPRDGERFRGAVRERQMMALLARCVGGMRTAEISGLQWGRARFEDRSFDALEVIRYKTRRKAAKKASKAVSRQLYPLADTVLPMFLRFWFMRRAKLEGRELAENDLLFPVRRARRLTDSDKGSAADRVGERRAPTSFANALRRDVQAAFKAASEGFVPGVSKTSVPADGSQRWRELFAGTDDRRALWFHNARNAAAVVAERHSRLESAAKFTGHASGAMLQHYREMAGEVDVVPVFPGLLPDGERLMAVLATWCAADGLSLHDVTGSLYASDTTEQSHEEAHGKGTRSESASISASNIVPKSRKNAVIIAPHKQGEHLRKRLLYPTELRERVRRKLLRLWLTFKCRGGSPSRCQP